MKILHVCPMYHPAVGGVENVFKAVSERLVLRGEDVTVFTSAARTLEAFFNPGIGPLKPGKEVIHGVKVFRWPYRRFSRLPARFFSHAWGGLRLPFSDYLSAWSALPWIHGLVSEIVRLKPDIILAGHFLTRTVYDACMAKMRLDVPLVYLPCLHLGHNGPLPNFVISLLEKADAIWTVTSFEKEYLLRKGISRDKVWDMGVGIDTEGFKEADGTRFRKQNNIGNEPLILFVGRKDKEKGVGTLVEAMEKVWKDHPETKIVLAGYPANYFKRHYRKHWHKRYGHSLISIDLFKEEEKKDLYAACDVFVLPSKIESFGIVYLEAWISGKPVIGADIGSTRSIIDDGKDGYLVRFGDAEALAKRITYLLNHPDVGKEMGARGREKVLKRWNWDYVTDELLELYRGLTRYQRLE